MAPAMASANGTACSSQNRRCQVLEDVEEGWEDFCMGLTQVNHSTTKEQCRAACCADPECEIWQWFTKRSERKSVASSMSPKTVMNCAFGKGFACRSVRTDDFLAFAGQRISHGQRLKDGVWCTGNGMRKRFFSSRLSHKDRLLKCRSQCFHDKSCHAWQYSTLKGCWSGFSDTCLEDVSLRGTIMGGETYDMQCQILDRPHTDYLNVLAIIALSAVILFCISVAVITLDCCRGPASSGKSDGERMPRRRQRSEYGDSDDDKSHGSPNRSPTPSHAGLIVDMQVPGNDLQRGPLLPFPPGAAPVARDGFRQVHPNESSFGGASMTSSSGSFSRATAPLLLPQTLPPGFNQQTGMMEMGRVQAYGTPGLSGM